MKSVKGEKTGFENIDLRIKENRVKQLDKINKDLTNEIFNSRIRFNPLTQISVNDTYIHFTFSAITGGVKNSANITVYREIKDRGFLNQDGGINFGTSGTFNPENVAACWRTIHAAIIINNWDLIMMLVEEYCGKYEKLGKEIKKQNRSF